MLLNCVISLEDGMRARSILTRASGLCVPPEGACLTPSPAFPRGHGVAVSAFRPAQTGEIVALKKVALRRLEDGIPNQALREIKALQEIEDNQYVSEAGVRGTSSRPGGPAPTLLAPMLPNPHLLPFLSTFSLLFTRLLHSSLIHLLARPLTSFCTRPSILNLCLISQNCGVVSCGNDNCYLLSSCYALQAGLSV